MVDVSYTKTGGTTGYARDIKEPEADEPEPLWQQYERREDQNESAGTEMIETLKAAVVKERYHWEAKRKYEEYLAAYRNGRHEYGEIMQVYAALAKKKKVISVNKAMQIAGVQSNGYPVLAIANAKARWCWFVRNAGRLRDADGQWNHPASAFVSDFCVNPGWRSRSLSPRRATKSTTFRFLMGLFPIRIDREIRAQVPAVPPNCLPSNRTNLSNHVILWEANWDSAPVDPVLLRRITREFFVVCAEWNLTEAERLVLETSQFAAE